jgi:hypothetical protein
MFTSFHAVCDIETHATSPPARKDGKSHATSPPFNEDGSQDEQSDDSSDVEQPPSSPVVGKGSLSSSASLERRSLPSPTASVVGLQNSQAGSCKNDSFVTDGSGSSQEGSIATNGSPEDNITESDGSDSSEGDSSDESATRKSPRQVRSGPEKAPKSDQDEYIDSDNDDDHHTSSNDDGEDAFDPRQSPSPQLKVSVR